MNNDTNLAAVLFLAKQFAKRCHKTKLLSGLPLENGRIENHLLPRVLANAGLLCDEINSKQFCADNLPILLLIDGQTAVITALEKQQATVHFFSADNESTQSIMPLASLQDNSKQAWRISVDNVVDSRAEEFQPSHQTHWFKQALKQVSPWYRDLFIASFLINLLAVVIPLFTMNVYDRVVPNAAFDSLWVLATGAFIAVLFDWILKQSRAHLTHMAGRQVDLSLSSQLFAKTLGMKLSQRPQSIGAFSKQIQEFDSVREFLTSATIVTLVDLPFTLLFLGLMAWLGGFMVYIPIAVMLLIIVVSLVVQPKIKNALEETGKLSTQRQAILIENLNTLVEIKQINGEGAAQRRWEQTVAALADWNINAKNISNVVSHLVTSSQQLVTIGLIITGVYQISAGNLSMGGLIAMVMLSGRSAGAINQVSGLLLRYQQARSSIQGLESVMVLEQENSDSQIVENQSFKGDIKLDGVNFSYPDQEMQVLIDINLHIKPGERVAIVGAAGAGKSSLLALLANQLSPISGALNYDNIDSKLWPASVIREHTGWVSQQPNLFFGSVLENICAGNTDIQQDKLSQVLQHSGVARLASRFSAGLESPVGESGRYLSGGQRQAVALARALLRDVNLLLLDEPSSAMDQQTENDVIEGLKQLPKEVGYIMVSHKPSMIALCSRIIVMDKGRIISDGPRETILPTAQKTPQTINRSRIKSVNVTRRES
ncbi:type I secretion system permease/ATPase [Psychromonas sp. psych-6C06]|uniref:type I secretion system permease/ATPase n=1 Tax=Psychromonas sp. psych-6C06 TaxID=2058089 RepID=UPI000C333190|nr:type I secretion system permease/ATPase [Psychromonas sp. psych-6C06]PKF61251.1 type I secretion system permease/ATPase [Psychromonas sp. psych-6C06]